MLILQNISYAHPNKDLLFENISLTVNQEDKIALVGNNGTGKSTLLKIISKELQPFAGKLAIDTKPYYIPQLFGQYNHLAIAQALRIEDKLNALKEILNGNVTESNLNILDDDWSIDERCTEALNHWQLTGITLTQNMETLSGGQKTKVFLAGISIHKPQLILLDEPSNHLDTAGRQLLYNFIRATSSSLVIVSHDRKLLNFLDRTYELNNQGISVYGGNYDFYLEQKQIENNALNQEVKSKEKSLRKAKEKERESIEKQQKLDNRAKRNLGKMGLPKIVSNTLGNNAEKSMAKMKAVHSDKIGGIASELKELRATLPGIDKMKFGFEDTALHHGKILFTAHNINFKYDAQLLWNKNLDIQINSGERIALKGLNGSGKTTLIHIILGKLAPQTGNIYRAESKFVYIDQDYSLIDNHLSVYEQVQQSNTQALEEYELKIRLNRFLFTKQDWDKSCSALSGGERMRLMLCCLTVNNQSPDMIILDEPTNNLDLQNIEILTAAINQYQGTIIVVSHDASFLEQINVEHIIELENTQINQKVSM